MGNGGFMNIQKAASLTANGLKLLDSFSSQKGHFIFCEVAGIILQVFESSFIQQKYLDKEQYPIQLELSYSYSGIMLKNAYRSLFQNCIFQNNIQSQQGGAIQIIGGNFECNGCNFYNNSALNGGAMFLQETDSITLFQVLFNQVYAQEQGGAINIYLPQGNTKISNSTIYEGYGAGYTGGIYYETEVDGIQIEGGVVLDNVIFREVKGGVASVLFVRAKKTVVKITSCQMDQVYGGQQNSISVYNAKSLFIHNMTATNIHSDYQSSFLFVQSVEEDVFINSSRIFCNYNNQARRILDEDTSTIQNDQGQRKLYDTFQWFNSPLSAPIWINFSKQFMINNLHMKNCIMDRKSTIREEALIIMGQDNMTFIDTNSKYEYSEGLNGGVYNVYQFTFNFLVNNTYQHLGTNQYGLIHASIPQLLFIHNCTFFNITSYGAEGAIISLLSKSPLTGYYIGQRRVHIRNVTVNTVKMENRAFGGFIAHSDTSLNTIIIESVTVKNLQNAEQCGIFCFTPFDGELHIISSSKYQKTEFSNFYSLSEQQFMRFNQSSLTTFTKIYIEDNIIDCQNKDKPDWISYVYTLGNEGIIRIAEKARLYTKNSLFRNCYKSQSGSMISMSTNSYEDEGSVFQNINGAYGAIVSCYGCLIKMKNTTMLNINAISGGLIALIGFCDVQLEKISAQGISAQSQGGFLFEQQFQSDVGYQNKTNIVLKNSQELYDFKASEGGLFYLFQTTTSLLIQNIKVQNARSTIKGGLFSVTDAELIQIENSRIIDIFSANGGFIYSSSNLLNIIIRNTKIMCDQNYLQLEELDKYINNKAYYPESKAYFVLQNTASISLYSNRIENCGNQNLGGVFSIQKTKFTDEKSIFLYNSGQYGGVFNAQESVIKLSSSEFYNNLGKTGGVINAVFNSSLTLRFCIFQNNNATASAGVLFLATQCSLNIYGSTFYQNQADENSVLEIISTNLVQDVVISKSQFKENKSSKNTISILYSSVILIDSKFQDNIALSKTKNILLGFVNITMRNNIFSSKYLADLEQSYLLDETTGSFIFLIFDVILSLDNCLFKGGLSNYGGAIFISGDSVISIMNSRFINNQAISKGGAIYSSGFKSIFIGDESTFVDNFAIDYGEDIYITNSFKTISLNKVSFSNLKSKNSIYIEQAFLNATNLTIKDINQNKQSKRGAGIYCNFCKGFLIKNSLFQNLRSSQGGAIYLIEQDANKGSTYFDQNEKFQIINSQFHNCSSQKGGALYLDNPQSINIINSSFISNQALIFENNEFQIVSQGSGGAIYYTCNIQQLNCKMNLNGTLTFQQNNAEFQGGAIFWDQLEPNYNLSSISFINNSGYYYGDDLACYSQNLRQVSYSQYMKKMIQIRVKNQDDYNLRELLNEYQDQGNERKREIQELNNQRSGGSIPIIYIAMMDKYGQIVGADFTSKVRVNIDTNNLSEKQNLYSPIIEGSSIFDVIGGIAVISDIIIVGTPGTSYQLVFSSDGIDLSKDSNKKTMNYEGNSNLDFDIDIRLRECEIGEQFTTSGKCQICQDSYSLVKMTQPGSCEVCPTEKAKCIEGAQIGPLPGYWRRNNESKIFTQCLYEFACLGMIPPKNILVGECQQGYQGILCADCEYGFSRNNDYQCSLCPESALNVLRLLAIVSAVAILIVFMIRSTLNGAMEINNVTSIYLKILLNHFQLILVTASFDFRWSQQIVEFFSSTKQVATASTQVFSFDCFLDTRSSNEQSSQVERRIFFQKLIMIALLPFLLTILCCIVWNIYKKIKKDQIEIRGKLLSSLVILLFLVHPSLVTYSFHNFKCKEVDSEQRVQDDLEIECWSAVHNVFSYFVALPSIIVWGLGIPFFAFAILIKRRDKLNTFEVRQSYGFLFRGYRKEYYFWEIVIMYRKIMIIFTSVFISNFGVVSQALLVFMILIFFLMINFKKQPFNTLVLNDLETLSLITSMITIYCGIFFILNKPKDWINENPDLARGSVSLSDGFQKFFFFLILSSNLCFFLFWGYKMYQEGKAKFRQKFTKIYLALCLCQNQNKLEDQLIMHQIEQENINYQQQLKSQLKKIKKVFINGELNLNKNNIERILMHVGLDQFYKIVEGNKRIMKKETQTQHLRSQKIKNTIKIQKQSFSETQKQDDDLSQNFKLYIEDFSGNKQTQQTNDSQQDIYFDESQFQDEITFNKNNMSNQKYLDSQISLASIKTFKFNKERQEIKKSRLPVGYDALARGQIKKITEEKYNIKQNAIRKFYEPFTPSILTKKKKILNNKNAIQSELAINKNYIATSERFQETSSIMEDKINHSQLELLVNDRIKEITVNYQESKNSEQNILVRKRFNKQKKQMKNRNQNNQTIQKQKNSLSETSISNIHNEKVIRGLTIRQQDDFNQKISINDYELLVQDPKQCENQLKNVESPCTEQTFDCKTYGFQEFLVHQQEDKNSKFQIDQIGHLLYIDNESIQISQKRQDQLAVIDLSKSTDSLDILSAVQNQNFLSPKKSKENVGNNKLPIAIKESVSFQSPDEDSKSLQRKEQFAFMSDKILDFYNEKNTDSIMIQQYSESEKSLLISQDSQLDI
ncbi:UNKNOWN [Stylonychia lemnae]|uniref:Transmembrane protein n=1 Tax=Stylonychia lemnae TaxID=5949 RepID=A0A078AJX0_STYLE|nr:UNKNOWN [Stylonychia lemnae]|eukprot:CDW82469.1 UNKNOWN [Stylonychia lemnae]